MARVAKVCMQSTMKAVNLILGMAGVSMVFYGFWMVRVWQKEIEDSSFEHFNSSAPWFIYTCLGTGITLCFITCLAHTAADSANGFCLSCYMVIIFAVLLLEAAIAADILLNSDWEKDLPEDPTGRFRDFREFVESNLDIFKWIGLLIILVQGLSILLATALRALGPSRSSRYYSDDEYPPERLPLMNHQPKPPAYVIGNPYLAPKNKNQKVSAQNYLA